MELKTIINIHMPDSDMIYFCCIKLIVTLKKITPTKTKKKQTLMNGYDSYNTSRYSPPFFPEYSVPKSALSPPNFPCTETRSRKPFPLSPRSHAQTHASSGSHSSCSGQARRRWRSATFCRGRRASHLSARPPISHPNPLHKRGSEDRSVLTCTQKTEDSAPACTRFPTVL